MLSRVYSCAVVGMEGGHRRSGVDTGDGLPKMIIVGLPDEAVQESRERVHSAIKNAGLHYPRRSLTVNLARLLYARRAQGMTCPLRWGCSLRLPSFHPIALKMPS